MGCYTNSQLARLKANRIKRRLDAARLANYKNLYLAARAAHDYLRNVPLTENIALVAQLDAALIDPHQGSTRNDR